MKDIKNMSFVFKLITAILLVTILVNFTTPYLAPVFAASSTTDDKIGNVITNLLGGVLGIFTWIPRLIAIGIAFAMNLLTAQVAYMDNGGTLLSRPKTITPYDIFFTGSGSDRDVEIINVNFLDVNGGGTTAKKIRGAVAQWYYIMRLISAAILLVILIYVGIKMAISSVAEEKALYKKSLVDWATSLALIFLLQYIIMFTVNVNNALVSVMKTVNGTLHTANGDTISQAISDIGLWALRPSIRGMACTLLYCMIVFQTFAFLLNYIKRMLTIGFLIIISPLISITYSIDKMGDGKAQALNKWLKEFVYNILIQPFHCIIYMVFLGVAFELMAPAGGGLLEDEVLPRAIFAIMCMRFIDDGEKLIRTIFNFENSTNQSLLGTAMAAGLITSAGKNITSAATTARKGINMFKSNNLVTNMKKDLNQRKIASLTKQKLQANNSGLNFKEEKKNNSAAYQKAHQEAVSQYNADSIQKMKTKKHNKEEKRIRKELASQVDSNGKRVHSDEDIDRIMQENLGNDGNFKSPKEQTAAFKAAKSKINERDQRKGAAKKKISGVYNSINSAYNSNTGRYVRKVMGEKVIPGGIGMALGAMTLGASATNPTVALGMGLGTYSAISQFKSSSSKTLARESEKYLDDRVSSRSELIEKCTDIQQLGRAGAYENDSDEMKEILDKMKQILQSLGAADKFSTLKSNIQYEATAHPESVDINEILSKVVGQNKAQTPELIDISRQFSSFTKDSNVYKQMQNGEAMGMELDDFTKFLNVRYGNEDVVRTTTPSTNNPEPQQSNTGTQTDNNTPLAENTGTPTGGDTANQPEIPSKPFEKGEDGTYDLSIVHTHINRTENYEEVNYVVDEADKSEVLRDIDDRIKEFNRDAAQIQATLEEIKNSGDQSGQATIQELNNLQSTLTTKIGEFEARKAQIEGPDPVTHGSNPDTGTNE